MLNLHHVVFVQYIVPAGAGAGIAVSIDLLELGGEAVPSLRHAAVEFHGCFVASLPDLWRMKARAFVLTRPKEKSSDLQDYNWILSRMVELSVEYDPIELLDMIFSESRALVIARQGPTCVTSASRNPYTSYYCSSNYHGPHRWLHNRHNHSA